MKSSFYNEGKTKDLLADFIKSANKFSMGEEVFKFEKSFAAKQERKFAVFVSSGSAANLVLIQALLNLGRLYKGDKIAASGLTWATNIMPLIQFGLAPRLLDCRKETLNVSPAMVEQERGIKALFLTNVLGFSDDIKKITDYCSDNNILLLEDNCESLGSKTSGKLLGNFGLASTFSFFVGHHFSTIEGGMICTDDEELHNMLILVRAHGWDRNLSEADQKKIRSENKIEDFYAKYTFYELAFNARPTEINGFLGNVQLQYLDEIISKREENFKIWQKIVNDNNDLVSFETEHMDVVSNFAMPVICQNSTLRESYLKKFMDAGVEIRPVIAGNIAKQPFYKKYVGEAAILPNTEFISDFGFYFGNNPDLTKEEVDFLGSLLLK